MLMKWDFVHTNLDCDFLYSYFCEYYDDEEH